ncbi:MAG: sulfur carrier protein ThiS [Rhodoplanes sp.]|uniref:sulfur carrier protein ThiS n=1 Tax=Rhodoplanes sp. TaxID=1968906 RepID=UPI0017E46C86|nr:sulfur carrier protein ThiS [Rhodoplanes sp.]NVO17908.1 sulfur carrier protein ThiS [Rhodoplanes sp.]
MTNTGVAAEEPGGITVNGSPEPHGPETVAALLIAHDIDTGGRGIAVALNGRVVPRTAWADTPIAPGDAVEIVRARPGG